MKNQTITTQTVRLSVRMPFGLCRHLASGRTAIPKTCIYDYECWKCPFDQWLEELDTRQAPLPAAA